LHFRYRGSRRRSAVAQLSTLGHIYRVKPFIRSLPPPAEFCLILFIGFGLSIAFEIWAIALRYTIVIDDMGLLKNLVQKLLCLGTILWIGRVRGWSVSTFGWRISWKGTVAGILLFIIVTTVKILVLISLGAIHPERPGVVFAGLTVPAIILLALINPFFEELLEAGYFIHALQRYGMWLCVLASSVFRGLLHVYQGYNSAAAILVGGLFIGFAYWRWRQLWPLVIAHFLDDFIGLLYFRHVA
jgi:membrane protease YdiL (CAAX protease family)